MSDDTRCIHCRRLGSVRIEQLIEGGRTVTDYYCAACERGWAISDSDWARSQVSDDAQAHDKPCRARS